MHESREDNISEEEQWAKFNTDRKRSSYIEKECFEKSQNHCNTGIAPPFLTSKLDGGDWSVSRPGRFTPGEEPTVPIGWEA
jgi:hypothetical protein